MSGLPFQYVVIRCVPRVDRGEFVNVGAVLFCQEADFLKSAWHADPVRLRAVHPGLDVDLVCEGLVFIDQVCAGDDRGGPAAGEPIGTRFGFLKAPRSTVLQPGPVHGGITADPERELGRLLEKLVS